MDCTNALFVQPLVQFLRRAGNLMARSGRAILRESGLGVHWRFVALLVLISFLTAWVGTRAVMAGFEDTWTEIALSAARHENQALRTRQDSLREQTEAALARLETLEPSYARTP